MNKLNLVKFMATQIALTGIFLPVAVFAAITLNANPATEATAEAAATTTEAAIATLALIGVAVFAANLSWYLGRFVFAPTFMRSRLTLWVLGGIAVFAALLFVAGLTPAAVWVVTVGMALIASDLLIKYIFLGWISE